jgi:hypothetical protein
MEDDFEIPKGILESLDAPIKTYIIKKGAYPII